MEVKTALFEKWREQGQEGKLTRDAKAAILGVSVATSERLLAGQGVDRPTLTIVFSRLGLEWEEHKFELVGGKARLDALASGSTYEPHASQQSLAVQNGVLSIGLDSKSNRHRVPYRFAAAFATILVLVFAMRPFVATKASAVRDPQSEMNTVLLRGSEEFHQGKYVLAEKDLADAVRMARENNMAAQLANALRMQGDLAESQGNLAAGKECYIEALNIWKSMNKPERFPAVLEALGSLETRTGEFEQASKHLNDCLVLFEDAKEPGGMAMASRNLGTLAYLRGDFAEAESKLLRAQREAKKFGKPDLACDIEARLALLRMSQGNIELARSQLMACLHHWNAQKHPRWVAVTQQQLGRCELAAGNRAVASSYFDDSRRGFAAVGDKFGAEESRILYVQTTGVKG